jgi:LPS-assembly protein
LQSALVDTFHYKILWLYKNKLPIIRQLRAATSPHQGLLILMSRHLHTVLGLVLLAPLVASAESADPPITKMGWANRAQINAMPAASRPKIDPTCPGVWITPIPAGVKTGDPTLSETDIRAQDVHYDVNGNSTLQGNVSVRQPGRRIDADNAVLTQGNNSGRFTGNILIAEPGLALTGDQADVDFTTQQATIQRTEFVSSSINVHGHADQIHSDENGLITIARGDYSTCPPDNRTWSLVANNIVLNRDSGRGTVTNAVLHIKDVPVMYLPYFNFPIDSQRQSGLLIPRFGSTSDGGFDLTLPIYLNLAPNYDATVTPRLMTNRGTMMEGEFRYLLPALGTGSLAGGYLANDPLYNHQARKSFAWKQDGNLTPELQLNTNVNYVSDPAYFIDFGTDLSLTNTVFEERTGSLLYHHNSWSLLGRVQSYQTIDPLILDYARPYARLPELLLTNNAPVAQGWQPGLTAETTYFQRRVDDGSGPEVNGARYRLEPALSYVMANSWGHFTPTVKVRAVDYELNGSGVTGNNSRKVAVPSFSLDSGLVFERETNSFTQTLEPRAFYLYAPYHDQSDLPNFDSANTTFSYQQLFRDTRFSGGDRLDDANQVSLGLTSRFLDKDAGQELLRASLGQIFYNRDRKVRLDPNAPIATGKNSGPAAQMTATLGRGWSGIANALWTPNMEKSLQDSVSLNYLPDSRDRLANISYTVQRADPTIGQLPLRQVSMSMVQPIGVNWQLLALWQYDLRSRETQDSLLGLQYEACCWKVRIFERRFISNPDSILSPTSNRHNTAFFIEVELKGLAGVSSSVKNLLSSKVFGYNQLVNNSQSSKGLR